MNGRVIPDSLDAIHASDYLPSQRHRWNTNEEIAAILIALDKHENWLSKEVKIRPKSGSMMLYSRKRVRYRRDGYCWKKRKDGKTTREDHMKLKVQGTECIYGCYVHSAILPTFHRRCYWLLQNPDIVLVHYLNVPYSDDNKVISPALNYFADNKKEWTKDELISELKPMFFSENEPDLNNELEKSTVDTIEAIVQQLMVKQRAKVKALEDASDGGINAKALTVVNAITNCAKQQQLQQQSKSTLSQLNKNKPMVNKRDVATCIITTPSNNVNTTTNNVNVVNNDKQLPTQTQQTVQLLQFASNSNQSATLRAQSNANNNNNSSGQSTPTSLIFNLSQFQSGSGLLILNSASASHTTSLRANESQPITAPLTLLYGRTSNTNSETHQISTVVCSPTNVIRASIPSKQDVNVSTISTSTHLVNNTDLNESDLINGNCIKREPIFSENNSENYISKADIHASKEYSDDNFVEDNNKNIDKVSTISLDSPALKSIQESGNNEESMIINSNPSSPEHQNIRQKQFKGNDVINNLDECRVDLNCNPNHSYVSEQLMPLTHSHNLNYNNCYNNNQNNSNYNNSLLNYSNDVNELNPMDFIDNDIPTPDETLFNLDAFDILGDIDNLDDLTANSNSFSHNRSVSISNLNHNNKTIKSEPNNSHFSSTNEYREAAAITDYSPEWCYPEGGIKVLVAGPWYTSAFRYNILFDGVSVATNLVQNGLLRCYSPQHEPGFVTLQVACDGAIISNSVIFEYRDHPTIPTQKTEDYFSIDENIFKFSLLERMELLESRLSQCTSKHKLMGVDSPKHFTSFEDRLISMCAEMANCSWLPLDESNLTSQSLRAGLSQTDMSLLHLAAALNYHRLIQCLLKWRTENPSVILEIEVDAFSCDRNECTPLIWSCAKGHVDSSVILYQWNRAAINLCNNTGQSPLQLARHKGFTQLVDEMERLENSFQKNNMNGNESHRAIVANMLSAQTQTQSQAQTLSSLRKASLELPSTRNICSSSLVKRNSACVNHKITSFPRLVKCLSADSSYPNFTMNSSNDQQNNGSYFLSSCISDSEDELEMSNSSIAGLSSSQRGSVGSCDIAMDCNSSEPSIVFTLAKHIIAAMPDRIKATSIASLFDEEFDDVYDDEDYESNNLNGGSPLRNEMNDCDNHQLSDNTCNFSFELTDNYNYREAHTPSNCSPASSSYLHSPSSFHLDSPSPPPTTADFCEFIQASGKITKELGDLTLTDKEQRELYEAAKVIQKAFRSYKGRKRQEEENKNVDKEKEKAAAILIQSYYRRYKQYIYFKQMTKAAQVIQNQYRNYCEHKRFKKSSPQEGYTVIDSGGQNVDAFICNYTDCELLQSCDQTCQDVNGAQFNGLKRTYSQRRQHMAARKIQQFMRQSKNKLQRERALAAEKESQYSRELQSSQTNQQTLPSAKCDVQTENS